MTAISVKNISKFYRHYPSKWMKLCEKLSFTAQEWHQKKWVIKNLSFTIEPGESVGIVGVNGAGKSTLLKLLTGITRPSQGKITVNGTISALLELGIGFHPEFSGRQNVFMSGLILGLKRSDIVQLMPEIERFAAIGDYIDKPIRVYSSGMQLRLGFAIATARRPDILIVDEALAVGDANFQAKCYQRIAEYKKQGTTLLLVSHHANDIVKHCERAIFLKDGSIEMDCSSRNVTNRYLDELYGKEPLIDSVSTQINSDKNGFLDKKKKVDLFFTRPGYRKEEYRWGQGGAKIIDYDLWVNAKNYPPHIKNKSILDFHFKVYFARDFQSVVPGMQLKTLEGLLLYGTNSLLSGAKESLMNIQAGEVRLFKFTFPLNMNRGNYLLSCGISASGDTQELIPLDRRYDSIILNVEQHDDVGGIIDLNAVFSTC